MKKVVTGKPALMKKINRNIVFKLIIKHGEISRSELSKITRLALPSIMRIVDGLLDEGLVVEVGKGESTGGRKPSLLTLNKTAMYFIGVEIAIKSTVVLTDLSGSVISSWTSDDLNKSTPEEILELIKVQIDEMLKKHASIEIAGIGIGTPGKDFKHTKELDLAILKGWEETDVEGFFKVRYDYPIFVDNVARTRTLSELWFGQGKHYERFIYVLVDRGVGCGIVNNGVILKGANDSAGEFGHNVIQVGGKPCYCGNEGCLEMYVSAGAITRDIISRGGQMVDHFETIDDCKDKVVQSSLRESMKYLGAGIGNLINTYNPEAVIIGGIVPMSSSVFREEIEGYIKKNIFKKEAVSTKVLISGQQLNEASLGSVALVINKIFESVELKGA